MAPVVVALQGLLHPSLNGTFYPYDLPEEWKLLYFANEFNACLLSYAELAFFAQESGELIRDEFKIYLFVDDPSTVSKIPQDFEQHIAGLVLSHTSQDMLELFSDCIFKWPVCLEENTHEAFKEIESLPLCHKQRSSAHLHCSYVSHEEVSNLRRFRARISDWQSNPGENRVVFVKAGTDIELFRRLNELVRLLS